MLVNRPDQSVRINWLLQDFVDACPSRKLTHLGTPGHHHYGGCLAVFKRPDEPDKLHSVCSRNLLTEQNRVVRLAPGQSLHRAVSIVASDDKPSPLLKEVREETCEDLRTVYDQH